MGAACVGDEEGVTCVREFNEHVEVYYESRVSASLLNTSLALTSIHYQTAVSVSKLPPGLPYALAAPVVEKIL